jgi:hypothetical protein
MTKPKKILANCTGFEWDGGNITKNWDKHDVSAGECEQIFFNKPLIVKRDRRHSTGGGPQKLDNVLSYKSDHET